jgi:hypothetical protein
VSPCELNCGRHLEICNEHGEIPECGPPWACARFGSPGHDYHDCGNCADAFETHLSKHKIADPNYGPKGASL